MGVAEEGLTFVQLNAGQFISETSQVLMSFFRVVDLCFSVANQIPSKGSRVLIYV